MRSPGRTYLLAAIALAAVSTVGGCRAEPAGNAAPLTAATAWPDSSLPDVLSEDAEGVAMEAAAPSPSGQDSGADQADSAFFPESLKGYELWAWEEGDLLWFTFVTGTNRNKTVAEVTQKNVEIRREHVVHINRSGWESLRDVLALVPPGSHVSMPEYLPDMPPLREGSRARILEMLRNLPP